jgi:protein-S-isoprenylcysteine O-methyltransferase Ste14
MNIGTVIFSVSMVWLASEILLALLQRAKRTDIRRDESSQKILWIVITISGSVGIFFGVQRFGHFGAHSAAFQIAGGVLIVFGIVLRWIAILTLRRQFTVDVAITEHHQLVKWGVYQYIRHPSYAGLLLAFLGLGLSFASYVSIAVIVIPIVVAFHYRIRIEERVLIDHFGSEYENYCASTKRLIPFVY